MKTITIEGMNTQDKKTAVERKKQNSYHGYDCTCEGCEAYKDHLAF